MTTLQVLLALSIAANGLLAWSWLDERDAATAARGETLAMQQQRDGIRSAASACSVGVAQLAKAGAQRAAAAEPARRAAMHNRNADVILSAPSVVPGDACASAQTRVDNWLKGRAVS